MNKILLVEDNKDLVEALSLHLQNHYELDCALDGEEGLSLALSKEYSLVILDISLPKLDGLQILKKIREVNRTQPVMMLTSRSEEIDKVVGLDLGADDYVTKPFSVAELLSRINALLRRASFEAPPSAPAETIVTFGDLRIDFASKTATLSETPLELTPTEFKLLSLFVSRPGQAFSRENLLENVWGYDGGEYSFSVNNTITRLRKKIEKDPANPKWILTVRGFGYRFVRKDEL